MQLPKVTMVATEPLVTTEPLTTIVPLVTTTEVTKELMTSELCPISLTRTAEECFYVASTHMEWQQAEDFCQTLGTNAHLATLDTQEVLF